jgi:hypothetical protein
MPDIPSTEVVAPDHIQAFSSTPNSCSTPGGSTKTTMAVFE